MENKIIVDCIKAMSSGNRIFVKMAKRVGLKPDATIPSPNYEEAGKPCFFVTRARFLDDANSGWKSSFNQAEWFGCSGNIYKGIRVYDKHGKPYYQVEPENIAHKKTAFLSLDDGYRHNSSISTNCCIPAEHVYCEVSLETYNNPDAIIKQTQSTAMAISLMDSGNIMRDMEHFLSTVTKGVSQQMKQQHC